jgi:hypothetical protein
LQRVGNDFFDETAARPFFLCPPAAVSVFFGFAKAREGGSPSVGDGRCGVSIAEFQNRAASVKDYGRIQK